MTRDELPTPFLTLDLEAMGRNVRRMQAYCDRHALAFRPHVKTHKMVRIARQQLEAGAIGITCQKLGEAELMAHHGLGDILVTFPLVGVEKANRAAALATRARLTVGADSEAVARGLSEALRGGSATIAFLVECDTGGARTGVQTPAAAADLAVVVSALPGLRFAGLMTHPAVPASVEWLREAKRSVEGRGLRVDVVSGGGTPHAYQVHEGGVFTELRAGTYVFGDRRCLESGVVTLEDCALRIRATVVSLPTESRAVIDAGSKTLSSDMPPGLGRDDFGLVVEHPEARLVGLSEEHGVLDLTGCEARPQLGDVVTIVPNHACGTVNLHDEIALIGTGEEIEITSVDARGLIR